MRLILVRHGKPEVANGSDNGNPPLSELGVRQAQVTAKFLANEHIDHIVASTMTRAIDTAAPLADIKGIKIETNEHIGEVDRYGGSYANIEMIKAKGPQEWDRFMSDPLGYFGVDGERFIRETLQGFNSIFDNQERLTIAVFAHGFPINILVSHVLGLDSIVNFAPAYCSLTRFAGGSLEKLTVASVNETGHLQDGLL